MEDGRVAQLSTRRRGPLGGRNLPPVESQAFAYSITTKTRHKKKRKSGFRAPIGVSSEPPKGPLLRFYPQPRKHGGRVSNLRLNRIREDQLGALIKLRKNPSQSTTYNGHAPPCLRFAFLLRVLVSRVCVWAPRFLRKKKRLRRISCL